jgi:hypothetical protein
VVAIPGDFNGDGRSDLAFHRPGGGWGSLPVLLSNGNGSFGTRNQSVPSWANAAGAIAIAGDYSGDGRTDVAFHRPAASSWNSVPVLTSDGSGGFASANYLAPAWANRAGEIAVRERTSTTVATGSSSTDGGDSAYDRSADDDDAFARAVQSWLNLLRVLLLLGQGYDAYVQASGLNGLYDGTVSTGGSSARAFLALSHDVTAGEVRGRLVVRQSTLRLDGGVCSDVIVPVSIIPVRASSATAFRAAGATTREVSILGVFSGTVEVSFDMTLETASYQTLTGALDIIAPWPCADQTLSFRFDRRPLI